MSRAPVAAVALAVALLAGSARAGEGGRTVTIPAKLFDPERVVALVGETVTWTNEDAITHTVTADDDSFDSGDLAPDETFSFTFARPGRYPYLCTIHRFMRGEVDVFALALDGPQRTIPARGEAVLRGLAPAGVQRVVLEQLLRGRVAALQTVTPAPDGSFRVVLRPRESGRYRATAGTLTSPVVSVSVSARIRVTTTRRGDAVTLHVSTSPNQPNAPVELQVYARELFAFVRAAKGRLAANSRATFTLHPHRPLHVRIALVRGVRGYAPGTSDVLVLRPQ